MTSVNKAAYIAQTIVINALRFVLALVFAFSGFVKAVDPMGTVFKLTDYAEAFGMTVRPDLLLAGVWALVVVEYVMGVSLFFGLYRRFYLWLMIDFLSVMTPLTLVLALTNPVSDCGCFGDAVVLTNWQTFGKNVALLVMAIVVLCNYRRIQRVISERMQWLVFVYASLSIIMFVQYNLRYLPVIDFRPYAIGTNIIDDMSVPDDAPQDEYETRFVLEKEGVMRTFTIDEYPDSSWHFVKRESHLVNKGYVPPITDFRLTALDGREVTEDVLEYHGYTFLVVAPDLKDTDEGMLDVINDLYDYAKMGGHPFYMLTASGRDEVDAWTERTGAAYLYLNADDILLKTMIRANPGLVILDDATIVGKWSAADMPRDEQLGVPMEHNVSMRITSREIESRHIAMALWMFFPLLLLVVSDKVGRRTAV